MHFISFKKTDRSPFESGDNRRRTSRETSRRSRDRSVRRNSADRPQSRQERKETGKGRNFCF